MIDQNIYEKEAGSCDRVGDIVVDNRLAKHECPIVKVLPRQQYTQTDFFDDSYIPDTLVIYTFQMIIVTDSSTNVKIRAWRRIS